MPLKLNKTLFSRPHEREKDFGDFFNKTSSSISNFTPFLVPLFIAPALITTNFFSKEIILMLSNISLSLGYLSNFAYRIYRKEVSKSELFISTLILSYLLILSYAFYPIIASTSLLSALGVVNQTATAVNLFFLLKHNVVPAFMKLIEKVGKFAGFEVTARYYSKPPLTLENDRFALDRLMMQTYGHDTFAPNFEEKKLTQFNKLLNKLIGYINKYDQPLFGYLKNRDRIANLESQINTLTVQGSSDSGYSFIRKKIGFKTTKLKLLEAAKKEVEDTIKTEHYALSTLRFFGDINEKQLKTNTKTIFLKGIGCLELEIQKQKDKIESLKDCLPLPSQSLG